MRASVWTVCASPAPSAAVELRAVFERVLSGEPQRTESAFRAASGRILYHDELFNPIRDVENEVIGVSVFVRDVTQRRHAEQTLQAVIKGTSASLGESFFRSLVVELTLALNARYAMVAEISNAGTQRVRSVAVCAADRILDNLEFALDGTLCAEAVGCDTFLYVPNVSALFPSDPLVAQFNIRSFLGVRLTAASGEVLGVLAVMHDKELRELALGQNILNIFAARAGAELERLQAESERRRTLAILDEAGDFIASFDLQGNLLYLNAAARRMFGIAHDEDVHQPPHRANSTPRSASLCSGSTAIPTAIRTGAVDGRIRRCRGPMASEVPVSKLLIAHRTQERRGGVSVHHHARSLRAEGIRAGAAPARREPAHGAADRQRRQLGARPGRRRAASGPSRCIASPAPTRRPSEPTHASWLELVHPDDLARLLRRNRRRARRPARVSDRPSHPLARRLVRHVHTRAEVVRDEFGRGGAAGRHHARHHRAQAGARRRCAAASAASGSWWRAPTWCRGRPMLRTCASPMSVRRR